MQTADPDALPGHSVKGGNKSERVITLQRCMQYSLPKLGDWVAKLGNVEYSGIGAVVVGEAEAAVCIPPVSTSGPWQFGCEG